MKLNKIGYLIKEGIKSIFTHGFMSFASITIIVACLIIMGTFSLLAVNVDSIIDEFEAQNEILAFVDDSLTHEEAMLLEPRIKAVSNVASTEFVTNAEAMDSFISKYDDEALFEDITADWFRDRFVIYVNDISLMQQTSDEIENIEGIAKVNAPLEISRGFVTLRNVVSVVSMILIIILFVVSIFIMANTIKLATIGRKEEIAIMKMVGASNGFIRWPFVIEGLVLGLVGGAVAFFIEWGVYGFIADKVSASMIGGLISIVPFASVMLPILGIFILIGLVVGVFGSNIAIRNYLKV